MLQEVTDADFGEQVLAEDKLVLVEFWASWCGPCRMVGPVLAEIAAEHADNLKIVKLDMDVNAKTVRDYGVMAAPTMLLFDHGAVVKSIVGAKPKAALLRDLYSGSLPEPVPTLKGVVTSS